MMATVVTVLALLLLTAIVLTALATVRLVRWWRESNTYSRRRGRS